MPEEGAPTAGGGGGGGGKGGVRAAPEAVSHAALVAARTLVSNTVKALKPPPVPKVGAPSPTQVCDVKLLLGSRLEVLKEAGCMTPALAAQTIAHFKEQDKASFTSIRTNPAMVHNTTSAGTFVFTVNPAGRGTFYVLQAPSAFPTLPTLPPSVALSLEVFQLYFPVNVVPYQATDQDPDGMVAQTLRVLSEALRPTLHLKARLLGVSAGAIITDAMPVVAPANYALMITGKQPPGWGAVSIRSVQDNFTYSSANGLTYIILSSDLFKYALGRKAQGEWRSTPSATPLKISAAFSGRDVPMASFTLQGKQGLCGWHPCAQFFHNQLAYWAACICHAILSPLEAAGVVGVVGTPLLDLGSRAAATAACVAGFQATEVGVVSLAATLCRTKAGTEALKVVLATSSLPAVVEQSLHMELMYQGSGGLALREQMKTAAVAAKLKAGGGVLSAYQLYCLEAQGAAGEYPLFQCLSP